MGIIHFVGGEKGGVGKSFFTKILISYHRSKGRDFVIYECDDVNRDIYHVYRGSELEVRETVFSQAEKEMDLANELLLAGAERDLIVNLPVGVHKRLGNWFKVGRVREQASALGVKLYLWYVCDGDRTNLELFGKSRESVPIEHLFVKNMVRLSEAEWEQVLPQMNGEGVPIVTIGKLGFWEAQALSQNYLSFETVQSYASERIGKIERNIIRLFLEDCVAELDRVLAGISQEASFGELKPMPAPPELEAQYQGLSFEYFLPDYRELGAFATREEAMRAYLKQPGTTPGDKVRIYSRPISDE